MRRTAPRAAIFLIAALSSTACADTKSDTLGPQSEPALGVTAAQSQHGSSTLVWNERAVALMEEQQVTSNSIGSRVLTYLSLAQYRAVLAAESRVNRSKRVSLPAAIGAASVVVLTSFFPAEADALQALHEADLAAAGPAERHRNRDAGEGIGRAIGAGVVALAATDGTGTQSPGSPPVGPGFWLSSGAPIGAALYSSRPFFMSSSSELRSPPPPAFGSPAFLEALAEVRRISDTRTPEQIAIALQWDRKPPPGIAQLNLVADALIRKHHRREREAARILAYANAAVFDAQIACFEAKFVYWFIRPVQADPQITMPIPLSNHPSYPSTHSCITSAFMAVLGDAFPARKKALDRMVEQAGLSRLYGGIHYRFDIAAGYAIGVGAAKLALERGLK